MTRISATIFMFFALAVLAVATPHGQVKRWGVPTTTTTSVKTTHPPTTTLPPTTTAPHPTDTCKPPGTTTITVSAPAATVTEPASQCNTGGLQCCDSVTTASSDTGNALLGLLGIVLSDINALLGINCSPLSAIGLGGNSCNANPVCCENNSFGSLISIGCIPIIIEL